MNPIIPIFDSNFLFDYFSLIQDIGICYVQHFQEMLELGYVSVFPLSFIDQRKNKPFHNIRTSNKYCFKQNMFIIKANLNQRATFMF